MGVIKAAKPRGDKIVNEKPSIVGGLTGRNDAIFLKNKYQTELDNSWVAIVNMVHYLETETTQLKLAHSKIPALRKNVEAHQKERADLYANLGNVLTKETDFESKMWSTTQKGRKVKSVTVNQKFKESDIDEIKYDSILDYFKQYPEYASKSTFKKILDKIESKESEIRSESEKLNQMISQYNFVLDDFEKKILKCEDKFQAYEKIKIEAETKLGTTRYNKGILSSLRSEKAKAESNLDLMHHRVDQFKNTLNLIKSELSEKKRKSFTEMEY